MKNAITRKNSNSMGAVERELVCVEQELIGQVGEAPQSLQKVVEHALAAGGKRIRPKMLLLCAAACKVPESELEELRPYAVAVEYLHTATLLHDDLVDGARLRRGETAAHLRFGPKEAVLAGDLLFARCLTLMSNSGNVDTVRILARATERMAVGEALELEMTRQPNTTEDNYYLYASAKTAALFSAASELGSVLAKAPQKSRLALARYGEAVGTAFQVADDILDITAPPERSGKERGTDLKSGIPTLPIIKALAALAPSQPENAVLQVLQGDGSRLPQALELVQEFGIAQATLAAQQWVQKSHSALSELGENAYTESLRALAQSAIERLS